MIPVSDTVPHNSDDSLIAMHADYSVRRSLFQCSANVEDKCLWGLGYTGSCRNPASENFYKLLSLEVPLTPPAATVVVFGKGKVFNLCGWGIFVFEIAEKTLSHGSGEINGLPVEFLMRSEVMQAHAAKLHFLEKARNPIPFCNDSCFACYETHCILSEKNSLHVPSRFCWRTPTLVHALSISPPASIGILSVLDYALPVPLSPELSSVLYALTSPINFQMTFELLNALDALKTAKCSTAALRIPDTSVPFALDIDSIITRMRSWIETASTSKPTELEGYRAVIRNYAAIREYFNLRDNLLGHVIATHASLNKLLIRLNRSFVLPSMRRDDLRFVATCCTFEKFRSLRAQPRSPLHLVYVGYRGELLPINLVEGEGTHPIRPDGNKYWQPEWQPCKGGRHRSRAFWVLVP